MKVHIGLAGLPYEVELRLWLACKLLMSSSVPVQLQKWEGKPCDILVADLDSEQGQVAYELAMHGNTRVLFLSKDERIEHFNGTRIDKHAAPSAFAAMLEHMLQTVPAAPDESVAKGLLGICLLQSGNVHEMLIRNSNASVVIRRGTRRIYASSREELDVAKQQLLDATWTSMAIAAPCEHQYDGLVSESLDSFLASACHRHQASLAPIGDTTYRLGAWPDLIAFPDNKEALRLSSALYRKGWRVQSLAEHCAVSMQTTNAFCWAMQASGVLKLDDGAEEVGHKPTDEAPAVPLVQRMVRRFGLKARQLPV
jgi:hypothetical protein